MGTLQAALLWAQRGFPVFPLRENTREPAVDEWQLLATTDAETIRRIWTDPVLGVERNYNVGTLCTNMVVVDIDVKNGKNGYAEYVEMGGTWDTLIVRSPSGGYHLYFHGPDSSNAPLSNGVDIRSHNGLVVAPGSTIDGKSYDIVSDRDMTWIPPAIEQRLQAVYVRTDVAGSEANDSPAAIEQGRSFAQSAPVAVEGQRGDETTFITAARMVREMALSVGTVFALLRDYWNPRCQPPWEHDELYRKVENAANYGSADLGRLSPENLFGHLNIPPVPSLFEQTGQDWGNATMPDRIPPRPWLMDRALMLQAVTIIGAAGSAGKSTVSLALAAHLALGLPFAGYTTRFACKTIIYNGEDDVQEQSRRLLAVCMAYNFDYQTVRSQILLLSQREMKLDLVTKDHYRPQRNDVIVNHLIEKAKDPAVGLLILDPLVKIHKCDESDNVQMDFVMETLTDIAHAANVAVLALHHSTKSNSRQEEKIGNADIFRGASSIVNAARIAFTLLNASQQDAEDYGFQDDERRQWVRMDDAKMNMTLSSDNATWFKKSGVRIPSNDLVGVLCHTELEKSRHHMRIRVARLLIDTMLGNSTATLTITQAATVVKTNEPLWANKKDTDIRKLIEGYYATPVVIEGKTVHIKRDADDKPTVVLT